MDIIQDVLALVRRGYADIPVNSKRWVKRMNGVRVESAMGQLVGGGWWGVTEDRMKSNNRALEGGPHVHLLPRPLYPRGSDGTHGKKACYSFVTPSSLGTTQPSSAYERRTMHRSYPRLYATAISIVLRAPVPLLTKARQRASPWLTFRRFPTWSRLIPRADRSLQTSSRSRSQSSWAWPWGYACFPVG